MAEISVKIKVGNRVYPLTVKENDKGRVEQAAQMVNGNINKLKQDYGLNDLVDLLAMTAFEFANQSLNQNQPSHTITPEDQLLEKKLSELKLQIEEILTLE